MKIRSVAAELLHDDGQRARKAWRS